MTSKTLPREPWRGSMICGYQISCGGWSSPPMAFCAERKAEGFPLCREHYAETASEYGHANFAPGNAVGESHWQIRLLWEPYEGEDPVEATAEEIALYAAILDPARGE